ncbi:MAG: hypothetical protein ABJD02_00520 [Paraglaciecola sp.]|uniref:IS66 family insertion sequence element accessory protein TnpA n=1 Tax=Paraglaciecola sp. TaxID=1920173 RepID=UPI003262CEF6
MKHKTLEKWRELITQQQSSELSIVDFCKMLRLSTSSFYKFRGQLQEPDNPPRFVKASKPDIDKTIQPSVSVRLGEVSLSFPTPC